MKVVYLAHPVAAPCACGPTCMRYDLSAGGVPCNLARARRWLAWALAAHPDVAFCLSWLPYLEVLPDSGESRARGLRDDCEMATWCDELWLLGGRISSGMARERDAMIAAGKTVVDLTPLGVYPHDR